MAELTILSLRPIVGPTRSPLAPGMLIRECTLVSLPPVTPQGSAAYVGDQHVSSQNTIGLPLSDVPQIIKGPFNGSQVFVDVPGGVSVTGILVI